MSSWRLPNAPPGPWEARRKKPADPDARRFKYSGRGGAVDIVWIPGWRILALPDAIVVNCEDTPGPRGPRAPGTREGSSSLWLPQKMTKESRQQQPFAYTGILLCTRARDRQWKRQPSTFESPRPTQSSSPCASAGPSGWWAYALDGLSRQVKNSLSGLES